MFWVLFFCDCHTFGFNFKNEVGLKMLSPYSIFEIGILRSGFQK